MTESDKIQTLDGYDHPALVDIDTRNQHGLPIARCADCGEIIDCYTGLWLHSARDGAARC